MHVMDDLEKAIEAADREIEESRKVLGSRVKEQPVPSKPTAAFGSSKRAGMLQKREYESEIGVGSSEENVGRIVGGAFSKSQRFRETTKEITLGYTVPNYDFIKKRTKVAHITRYNLTSKK